MKTRALWIALLLSLSLNLGLGVNLWRRGQAAAPDPPPSGAAGAPAPAAWREGPRDPEQTVGMLRHRLERLQRRLELTDAQRDSLWHLHRDLGPQVLEQRRALMEARHALHGLLDAPAVDAGALDEARRRITGLQGELDSLVVAVMLRERAILTPEQAERYRGLFPFGGPDGRPDRGPGGRGSGRHRHRSP